MYYLQVSLGKELVWGFVLIVTDTYVCPDVQESYCHERVDVVTVAFLTVNSCSYSGIIYSKSHEVESTSMLPSAVTETLTHQQQTHTSQPKKPDLSERCDKCKTVTAAVSFCLDCNKKLCSDHKQVSQVK